MEPFMQQSQQIGSFIGKLLRDSFGKGPESVFVSLGSTFITIYIRNFLSPAERILLERNQSLIVNQMREQIMDNLSPEMKAYIEAVTGNQVKEIYFDWGLHNQSGMIVGLCENEFEGGISVNEQFDGKEAVDDEVVQISRLAQRAPDEVYSCELNSRTVIVVRYGLLVRIEKELIRLGQADLLKSVKRNLEKSYLHHSGRFETALKRRVVDIFVDWDFDLDKSVIVIVMHPNMQ